MIINFDNIDDLYIEEPHYLGPSAKQKLYVNDTLIWAKMTVYFDVNTGSSVNNKTVYYNRTYGTLPTTSKTGHTFNGWFTDETWGTEVTEETICNQVDNHTLYAKLDINYYTVTWKDWDGTTLKSESVAYGGNGTPPSQPTRTGYTFSGWSGTYTNVTSNRTITATYTINYYTVTFKDWDGTTLKTQTVAYGSNATPPSNPTRTGYTFSGWSGDYTNVTSNRTITAIYTAVNATSWSILGAGNYAYVASFEKTAYLVDPTRLGCGFYISDLPSASLYSVGDIVRGRLNPASGGMCDTWAYFEAV